MSIQALPADLIGNVADKILRLSGTEGVVNRADLPVLMKYLANLSLVNRHFKASIDEHTPYFIGILAKKYNFPPEHIATLMDSAASRVWLWKRIQQNGDQQTFEMIQKIYDIADKILRKFKENDPDLDMLLGNVIYPTPNPYYSRTQTGFGIEQRSGTFILKTPFGEINLLNLRSYYKNPTKEMKQQLFEQLRVIEGDNWITRIGELPAPKAQQLSNPNVRTYESVLATWKMLERAKKKEDVFQRLSSSSTKLRPQLSNFRNLNELVHWIDKTLDKLHQQPSSQVKDIFGQLITIKALPLKSLEQVQLLRSLNPERENPIWDYDPETFSGLNGYGVYIRTPYDERALFSLKDEARSILRKWAFNERNWATAKFKDYHSQIDHESEETHVLFVCTAPHLRSEARLFLTIIEEMGLSQVCKVKVLPDSRSPTDRFYLWVKKEAVEKLKEIFSDF